MVLDVIALSCNQLWDATNRGLIWIECQRFKIAGGLL